MVQTRVRTPLALPSSVRSSLPTDLCRSIPAAVVQPSTSRAVLAEPVCRLPGSTSVPKAVPCSPMPVALGAAAGSLAAPAGEPAATSVTPAVATQASVAMAPRSSRGLCRGLSPGILVDEWDMVPPQGRRHEGP